MIEFDRNISEEEANDAIEAIAADIVRRRLETPAVMFLEMNKPLSFAASQALIVGTPLLGVLFGVEKMQRYSQLLRSKENVEKLIRRIESLSGKNDTASESGEDTP